MLNKMFLLQQMVSFTGVLKVHLCIVGDSETPCNSLMVITEQSNNCNIVIFVKFHARICGKKRKTFSIGFYDEFPEISRQF